jgi:hypothetical protein
MEFWISKIYIGLFYKKAFFFSFWHIYLFLVFVSARLRGENYFLEMGHIGYKKNREFYADFKNANLPQ